METGLILEISADNKKAIYAIKSIIKQMEGVSVTLDSTAKKTKEVSQDIEQSFESAGESAKSLADHLSFPAEAAHKARVNMLKSLDQIEKDFHDKFKDIGNSIETVSPKISSLESLVNHFGGGVKLAAPIGSLKNTVDSLNPTIQKSKSNFTAWTRVIQDLPYGFNAISNNLEQIVPAAGFAGLAFSGLIAALTFADIGFGAWNRGASKAKKVTEEFTDALSQNRENAAQEISQLKALESVAANTSLSMDKRLAAVKKLRSEYPNYFKDLTNEQILTGQVTSATDQLTSAIYARAEARAREADIAKKANIIFENQQKIEKINNDLITVRATKAKGSVIVGGGTLGGISGGADAGYERTLSKESSLLKEKDKLLTENNRLQVDVATSQQRVNQISDQTILLDEKETDALKKKNKEKKKQIDYDKLIIDDHNKLKGLQPTEYSPFANTGLAAFKKQQEKEQGKQVGGRLKDSVGSQALGNDIARITEERTEALKAMTEQMKKFQAVSQLAANSVDLLFTNLKQGQNIADALIGVFENLANEIAKAAAKAVVLSIVASAFGIGETNIFKNFGKILGFATGGTVTGPNSGYPVMLHGTEHIVRPDQMKSIISGAAQMGSQSGGGQMAVVLSSRVAGNDIYLSQKRTNYFRGLTT